MNNSPRGGGRWEVKEKEEKEEEVNREVGGLKITLCNNTTSPLLW